MSLKQVIQGAFMPLASRKVRVAVATVLAAYAALMNRRFFAHG
jgi:hypothetical protein